MKASKVLLVDDDKNLLRVISYHIEELGFEVLPFSSPLKALARLGEEAVDLVITDLRMPEMDGLDLLKKVRTRYRDLPVIVLTAYGTIDKAVEAVKLGASDFLSKPFEKAEIQHAITKALQLADLVAENQRLSQAVEQKFEFKGIIGSSRQFQMVLEQAEQLAAFDTTVLIQGESGTGKELLARAIHFNSPRKACPFVVVNCGAIPHDLMESELFGHRKGAFTGAISDKKGKFEVADSGTVFLDEVGELIPSMQVKLLRVLQEREIDVVGDPHPRSVDVRILAATNRDLESMMKEGHFREDLFYRLAVAPLHVPALKLRREDIPLLIHSILGKVNLRFEKEVTFDQKVIDLLQEFDWPGNIRELENMVERLVVFSKSGRVRESDLPPAFSHGRERVGQIVVRLPEGGISLTDLEKDVLRMSLEKHDWNQTRAAKYLGISRNTLIYRIQKFGLKRDDGHI